MAQLPELISDVLSCVCHCPIRTHDDLVSFVLCGARMRFKRHYPTAFGATFCFEANDAGRLHQLERSFPEMQVKNL